eukprot:GAFH01003153.1.p1 GENE.GAFH01003153.1~~GAFH01003153.1.p1  ORF type:complete len:239 (-),score=48.44 GAFH01003153.1:85-801(-)
MHKLETASGNPYEQVIRLMGQALEPFDDDHLIPSFGFGDQTTGDRSVFSFLPGNRPCNGFDGVLEAYRRLVPYVVLSGPTSFAPAINAAIDIVIRTAQYHILVILTDGQVSDQRKDAAAIVEASKYPLSIIVVGVGDGPWEVMNQFDDELPERNFDNFQFVQFSAIGEARVERQDLHFATQALMEVPEQYRFIKKNAMLAKVQIDHDAIMNRPAPPIIDPPIIPGPVDTSLAVAAAPL